MNEQIWLTSDDPILLLNAINGRVSERKQKLFSIAVARSQAEWWTSPLLNRLVELDEWLAEGIEVDLTDDKQASLRDDVFDLSASLMDSARLAFRETADMNSPAVVDASKRCVASTLVFGSSSADEASLWLSDFFDGDNAPDVDMLCEKLELDVFRQSLPLLRCIVGNLFRRAKFQPDWRTSTVLALARQIYETQDYTFAPILADALTDAGCPEDSAHLEHLRGPGPHCLGCHVVDVILNKS